MKLSCSHHFWFSVCVVAISSVCFVDSGTEYVFLLECRRDSITMGVFVKTAYLR